MDNYVTYSNGEVGEVEKVYAIAVTDNTTLTANDSGKIILVGTDAKTITLPPSKAGLTFTFVNIGAAGNNILKVSPVSTEGISGTITLASSVVVLDGTVNKAAINTKATSVSGDSLTILGTGLAGSKAWVVTASTGIWAREA
ncbi:hypothetical protein [Chryseobacterium sp. ON_d1]|uniref:hypothetical protein n=1 Tax=Chryseobacterium sp. ON_d1 TaxID=2583211 RepID=UPI001156DE51|nr:hypothetical protein [Chryseobacterium sp. ON_d1]GEJ46016.1 hypothetical protein CRS_26240 [Chryseobacterium sp. ON_d1]